MNDKRELARREALETWFAALRWQAGATPPSEAYMREAELAFDKWWHSLSRRGLQRRAGRR